MEKPASADAALSVEELQNAAMEGYCVPEEDEVKVEKSKFEETRLSGDDNKLSSLEREVIFNLKDAQIFAQIHLKQVSLSFSGASVYFCSPMRKDGTPMASSVLKFDTQDAVEDEIRKTQMYAPLFGLTTPQVKDKQFLSLSEDEKLNGKPAAVMQIDLCGGCFGLPEFASAPPVVTFASVFEKKLDGEEQLVDVLPMVNEAFERRLHTFTMSARKVQKVNLASMYKIVRFVGHGVLNRAKEGSKRAQKSAALAAGFLNPPDIDDLDPDGCFMQEITGKRMTIKTFFKNFAARESAFNSKFQREVVLGLCHNDMHGGNLLLDSQGLIWLIDFATAKKDIHVLMDITKFIASCLFLYLKDTVSEKYIQTFAKLLATTPDTTTSLPLVGGEDLKNDATGSFVMDLLGRLRHCACIYEIGDDAPSNDGMPFVLALFSWSVRMLSYSEPNLYQKTRAVYWSLVTAQRVLWDIGDEVGPVCVEWIEQFRQVWEGQKGRRLSASATQVQVVGYEFHVEFPRYLAQVGTSEAWSSDFLTRERVHVTENCVTVDIRFTGRLQPSIINMAKETSFILEKLQPINQIYIPVVMELDHYFGRLLVIGDSGTGKTMLTKQLFSEVAQKQLLELCGEKSGIHVKSLEHWKGLSLIPIRLPLIDLGRQLEAEPDTSLEADPINDLFSQWAQRKYGQDSAPHKFISDVRNACLGVSTRRFTMGSEEAPAKRVSIGSAGDAHAKRVSINSAENVADLPNDERLNAATGSTSSEIYAMSEIAALFLLLDGLDEASTTKAPIFEYFKSFLENEPIHISIMTTRPGVATPEDMNLLSDFGFHALMMSSLSVEQATDVTQRILRRMKEPEESIAKIHSDVVSDGYQSMRGNPMILTLLIHVLRKYHQQIAVDAAAGSEHHHQEAMKKVEVYQRAVKLMLHQSDAAKFMLRDGRSDKAMVRRIEMMKSVRARKLFQTIGWYAHCLQRRGVTWSALEGNCTDTAMLEVMREAHQQGRMPIFEQLEVSGQEPLIQMAHLSFQELLVAEYTSAIVNHTHANNKLRSYMNVFLSNSMQTLERERLSMQWWLQVWIGVCDILQPGVLAEWSTILTEDERCKLKVGSLTYRYRHPACLHLSFNFSVFMLGKWPEWLSKLKQNPVRCYPLTPWNKFYVTEYDRENAVCRCKYVRDYPGQGFADAFLSEYEVHRYLINMMDVMWPLEGVGYFHRESARALHMDIHSHFLDCGIHCGLYNEWSHHVVSIVNSVNGWPALRMCVEKRKVDYVVNDDPYDSRYKHFFQEMWKNAEYWDGLKCSEGGDHLRSWQPYGVLEQAYAGTLELAPWVDPNFSDPASGMTPLMCATAGGHVELVGALLAWRARIDRETTEGATAITFTSNSSTDAECLKLLIAARADVRHRSGKTYTGRTYFDLFGRGTPLGFEFCIRGQAEKLDILLQSGYPAGLTNNHNISALWGATISGMGAPLMKKVLGALDLRTNPFVQPLTNNNIRGFTRAYFAYSSNGRYRCFYFCLFYTSDTERCRVILDTGVNPQYICASSVCLRWYDMMITAWMSDFKAMRENNTEILDFVLERGYDFNKRWETMLTPMEAHVHAWQLTSLITRVLDAKGECTKLCRLMGVLRRNNVLTSTVDDWLQKQRLKEDADQ